MFLKISKKKFFASILACFTVALCIFASYITLKFSQNLNIAGSNNIEAGVGDEQSNQDSTTHVVGLPAAQAITIDEGAKALASVGATYSTINLKPDTWVIPLKFSDIYVTSSFGPRNTGIPGASTHHGGIDLIMTSVSTENYPIIAANSGKVIIARYDDPDNAKGSGNYVAIEHNKYSDGSFYITYYMHMSHFVVANGQEVKAGQVIGYIGSTGTSSGAHLHYQINYKLNGTTYRVNPNQFIGRAEKSGISNYDSIVGL